MTRFYPRRASLFCEYNLIGIARLAGQSGLNDIEIIISTTGQTCHLQVSDKSGYFGLGSLKKIHCNLLVL